MKKTFAGLLFLAAMLPWGCTGSGAVNPLTPTKASQADASMATSDMDTVYWTSYPVTFGLTDPILSVCMLSKKSGWACGNNGMVLRYDGETWSKVDTGLATNQNLYAISFVSDSEGWAVGTQGVILHYNNGNWTLDPSPTQQNLYGLVTTRSRTAWAVGSSGTILAYNGISWGTVTATGTESAGTGATTITNDILSVGLSSQNNGWAVGNLGLILHYDGTKWQTFPGSPTTEKLTSVSVINDQQAWAVGSFGTILRYNGTTWSKVMNAFSGFDLYQIAMRSDDDGWAIGQDGTIIYYDGTRWIAHQKPDGKPALNSLAFYNDTGYIVGQNGTILKFQAKGIPATYDFLFKGEVTKKPSKANPYWTFTYTLMNQSARTSPPVTLVLPIPSGFEPYQEKPAALATPGAGLPTPAAFTPTPLPTATPTVLPTPAAAGTPGAKSAGPKAATAVSIAPIIKDGAMQWEIGTVAASEMKAIKVLLQEKKGERAQYPAYLKAVLKSGDKVIAEAASLTFSKTSEPIQVETAPASGTVGSAQATPIPKPTKVPTPTPSIQDNDI